MLIRSYVLRIILFILLLTVFFIEPIYSLIIFMVFSLIDGYTWAYISTILNIVAIRYSREDVGFSNFIRNMGYVAGASLSGIIIPLLGYQMNIILAVIALGLSTAIFMKSKVE
jgi:predicted MFS family arabinose efflux permease